MADGMTRDQKVFPDQARIFHRHMGSIEPELEDICNAVTFAGST